MDFSKANFALRSLVVLVVTVCYGEAALAQSGGLPTSVGGGVARVGSGVPTSGAQPASAVATQQAPNTVVSNPALQQLQQQQAQQQRARGAPGQQPSSNAPMPSPIYTAPNLVNEALDQAAPLTPGELRELRRELEARKSAMSEVVNGRTPPKPTTAIYNLDLSPGVTPPVVRIEVGQGSIISFLDAAGRPWPARVADNFSPKVLTLSQFTEHQLSIGTTSELPVNAGVAVALEGVPVAITFSVISGQSEVDTQVHMVMPQYRNGTPPGVGSLRGEPSLTAGDLMSYLLRTPPASARKLSVEGVSGAMAWQISKDRMVVRTNALVAAGAFRVQGIGDGTFVYELPLSPQVRVVQGDKFISMRISGFVAGGQ